MNRREAFWLGVDYWISEWVWKDPNITISSKTAEARDKGKWWGCIGCKVLNWMFKVEDHCSGAEIHDIERAQDAQQELNNVELMKELKDGRDD